MKKSPLRIGVDIGGTHVSAALVETGDGRCLDGAYVRDEVDPQASATRILEVWARVIDIALAKAGGRPVESIGIAMPGPFDYHTGTAMITGLAKYERLYGLNIREALQDRIANSNIPIFFGNDAACFGLGETRTGAAAGHSRVIAITLGTGLGA
ncbi:MAG: ROK family protein, partial [Chitinophaga rupis]